MHSALVQFGDNLRRARELGTLAVAVSSITTVAIDVTDMWRAQIVLGVSALDHFVHELTRLGMIDASKGNRPRTDGFLQFQLSLAAVERAFKGEPHETWLGDAVRDSHSWLSFQRPEKIADAVRLISPVKLWEEVGKELNQPAKDVKLRLDLIIERRNRIAHEADMDPANPGFRWPITETLANDAVLFLEKVGQAIFKVTT
jgi:hypothetical protein